jgi:DNA-directed RNA polymerase subunit K/omega
MTDIKSKVQNIDPNIRPRNVLDFRTEQFNVYETLVAISKRAKDISGALRTELHGKLEEFSVTSDTIEEIQENKEQIEISKFYERLPNPVIIATEEYLSKEYVIQYQDEVVDENED